MNRKYKKQWNIICGGMNNDNKIKLINNLQILKRMDYDKSFIDNKITNILFKFDNEIETLNEEKDKLILELKENLLIKKRIIHEKKLFKTNL